MTIEYRKIWDTQSVFPNAMRQVKLFLKKFFSFFGFGITSKSNLEKLIDLEKSRSDAILKLLLRLPVETSKKLLEVVGDSKSQLQQDLFVLGILGCKRGGFYVEFGATDGISLSNTYLLETKFGWNGILAEPALEWKNDLIINRPNSHITNECVWKSSGEKIAFLQTKEKEFSTIAKFSKHDVHESVRQFGSKYDVDTISLEDLLRKFGAPKIIDFLSIDTEGSEFAILESFDFDSFQFSVIVCEHNFTVNREKIYNLLISKGYSRVMENLSLFDDWYVLGDLAKVVNTCES